MKTLKLLLLIPLIGLIQSCNYDVGPPEATLVVRTEGYLSGKTRPNIMVQLYYTREDAEDQVAAITPPLWTDSYGEAVIYDLDVNRRYFIRADSRTTKTIRSSKKLDFGDNHRTIRIL